MRSLVVPVVVPVVVASVVLTGACAPTQPITVVHLGQQAPPQPDEDGDPVKLRRPPTDAYSGVGTGAYVIRSEADWQRMWQGELERPEFPKTIDPTKEMLVVIANRDEIVSKLAVTRAAESAGLLTIWVRQTMLGEGCVRTADHPPALDAVVTTRMDKPLKVLIEDEDEPSCGEPPKAELACRRATEPARTATIEAKVGDVVECELSALARGRYELVDQMLSLQELPPSSNAKLRFSSAGTARATLALDAFGTYAVRGEVTDEAGRKGYATALIDVLPSKTRDVLVQLAWADVGTRDTSPPAPRVLLRVAQEGRSGQRCSAEVPVPGLCEAKTRGAYTYMKIPASRRKLPLSLLYLDERPQGGPSPCVNVWFDGERTATMCDHAHRHAEDRWEIGTIDTSSGKVAPPRQLAEAKPLQRARP